MLLNDTILNYVNNHEGAPMTTRLSDHENKAIKTEDGKPFHGQHLFEYFNENTQRYSTYIAYFDRGLLHREKEPAVTFSDGYEEWWEHGKFITAEAGFNPAR